MILSSSENSSQRILRTVQLTALRSLCTRHGMSVYTSAYGSQQRWSGALGQIFGALVLHSYPLFGSLCHHSSQPPQILRILISVSSTWWSCCVFLGIPLSAPWSGMGFQAESQHDAGAHLICFLLSGIRPALPIVQGLKTVVSFFFLLVFYLYKAGVYNSLSVTPSCLEAETSINFYFNTSFYLDVAFSFIRYFYSPIWIDHFSLP